MYTVMVTGGLGSGKSTLCEMIRTHGACGVDLDAIARTLLEDDEEMVSELADRFGEGILDDDGNVVPARLAEVAFADRYATQAMNAITFPRIAAMASDYILDVHCTRRSDSLVLVVEVPLLAEMPEFADLADEVIAVIAPKELCLRRSIERGMDPEDAMRRLEVQSTDADRAVLADTIYENTGSREAMRLWVDAWWNERTATLLDEIEKERHGSGTE